MRGMERLQALEFLYQEEGQSKNVGVKKGEAEALFTKKVLYVPVSLHCNAYMVTPINKIKSFSIIVFCVFMILR